jgi:2-keto-3-deoxy-L-rhamnonate aldolase RhmA
MMGDIRINRVKQKLSEGKPTMVLGGLPSPEIIDYLGQFGFDGMWIDTEHSPNDFDMVAQMCRACNLWDVAPFVRVSANQHWIINRTLDVGAMGVIVPHSNTVEDVKGAVNAAKYWPKGARGSSSTRHSFGVDKDYYNKANEQTMVVALIEEYRAIKNLKDMTKVEGVDVFLIGPGDLSHTMGLPGQGSHPKVQEAVEEAIDIIVSNGKVAGATGASGSIADLYKKGVRFFFPNWQPWLGQKAREYMTEFKALK